MRRPSPHRAMRRLALGACLVVASAAAASGTPPQPPGETAERKTQVTQKISNDAAELYRPIRSKDAMSLWPAELAPPTGWKPSGEALPLRRAVMQLGDARYRVVINHEEQYSIWPADQPPPEGFEPRGGECRPRDCAESIASAGGRPERPR